MRALFALTATVCALTLVGCTNSTKPGTPAATGKTAGNVEYDVFPTEILVLKPGESKDVKLTRKAKDAKDMKDTDLTVTSSDPKVKVEGGKFKGDAKDATVTIKADPDAPAKEHTITIKAGDVTKTVHVRVEAAGAAAPAAKK
jgi:hypothetical protein